MKIIEFDKPTINENFLDDTPSKIKKGAAVAALAASTLGGISVYHNFPKNQSYSLDSKVNSELTSVGQSMIKNLPMVIQKRIGDPKTIEFVSGIPDGGESNAVCQVAEGERIIYVNPRYIKTFLSGAADQLVAHELTHILQDHLSSSMRNKFPVSGKEEYGKMTSPDAWKILAAARKKGDRMWNHNREEQAMISQQREAQFDILQSLINNKKDQETLNHIKLVKNKIFVYDQYINDYDSD
jgi:hypothetical protein